MLLVNNKELKIYDVIIVGMFVFGLAYCLANLNAKQNESLANYIIEASPQSDNSRISLELRKSLEII